MRNAGQQRTLSGGRAVVDTAKRGAPSGGASKRPKSDAKCPKGQTDGKDGGKKEKKNPLFAAMEAKREELVRIGALRPEDVRPIKDADGNPVFQTDPWSQEKRDATMRAFLS